MKTRTRKIVVWTALWVAGVGAIVATAYFFVLPRIVHDRVAATLHDAGLKGFDFHVSGASLWAAKVSDLTIGRSENKAGSIEIDYSWSGLRQGRIEAIRVNNLTVAIGVDANGRIDWGDLAPMLAESNSATTVATTVPTTAPTQELPVDRIELVNSQILVQSPDKHFRMPVAGVLVKAEPQRFLLDIHADLGGTLLLSGSIAPYEGSMMLNLLWAKADALAVSRLASVFTPGSSFAAKGLLRTQALVQWENRRGTLDARVAATQPAGGAAGQGANVALNSGVLHVVGDVVAPAASLRVTAYGVGFSQQSDQLSVEGLSGDVTLSALSPPRTGPKQRVTVKRLKIGEVELTDGLVEFHVESAGSIFVEHTEWNWLDGKVFADGFRIRGADADLTLRANEIALGQLLALLAQGQASAQGRLSGSIDLRIHGSSIAFGNGHVAAIQGGPLQITRPEQLVESNEKTRLQFKGGDQMQRLVDALRDFQYNVLSADLKQEAGGLVGYVHLSGQGRKGPGDKIEYDLHVRGLDKLLRLVLGLREAMAAPHNGGSGKAE